MRKLLKQKLNTIEQLLIKKVKDAIGINSVMTKLIHLHPNTWNSYKEFFLSASSAKDFKLTAEFILWLNHISDERLRSFSSYQESFEQFQIDKRNGVQPKLCL